MSDHEHIVEFHRGHDCIKFQCMSGKDGCKPGADGSHGVGGLGIYFVVKGKEGAVDFALATGWLPVRADKKSLWRTEHGDRSIGDYPIPRALGYHSKAPRYEGQQPIAGCELMEGGTCYYDSSMLNAEEAFYTLRNGGDEELWKFMEQYYEHVFHGGAWPTMYEYPFDRRSGYGHGE